MSCVDKAANSDLIEQDSQVRIFLFQTTNLAGHLFEIHYGPGDSLPAPIVAEQILAPTSPGSHRIPNAVAN